MFDRFGAATNPSKAIIRINAYYDKMVEVKLYADGKSVLAHPELDSRLRSAAALLGAKGFPKQAEDVSSFGGFNIRRNANNPNKLSNHSFGWAVDLDPVLNPNTPKASMPSAEILALTGIDPYGEESTRLRELRTFEDSVDDLRILSRSSKAFVTAFANSNSLKTVWQSAMKRLFGLDVSSAAINQIFADAAANPPKPASVKAQIKAVGVPATNINATAAWMLSAAKLLKLAADPDLHAGVTGTAAQIAKFGYFNLGPELIASLIASDGGGLNWLGTALGTKDYMHNDLREADQPSLF
jgi:hypothetical protein